MKFLMISISAVQAHPEAPERKSCKLKVYRTSSFLYISNLWQVGDYAFSIISRVFQRLSLLKRISFIVNVAQKFLFIEPVSTGGNMIIVIPHFGYCIIIFYLFPFPLLCVLHNIWQFSISVLPPLLHAVTWSASISVIL